jgi:transposase InsO family protein
VLKVSERRACKALGQHRSTQRKAPRGKDDEAALVAELIELARSYGRYGYRKVAALLRADGWLVNDKRVERLWRQEGLKVPARQPKRARLWDGDGSCIRLRPEHRNHVWSYDFVEARTHDGRKFRMLNVLDEFTRECLAIRVDRKLKAADVIDVLSDLFILRGVPAHIRSDNGPEFIAKSVQSWIAAVGARTAYITPGSPWENGYVESFNAQIRNELLNGEIFYTLKEAQIMIEGWRRHYNTVRPHGALGYRPPAPEVFVPAIAARPAAPAKLAVVQRPTWTCSGKVESSFPEGGGFRWQTGSKPLPLSFVLRRSGWRRRAGGPAARSPPISASGSRRCATGSMAGVSGRWITRRPTGRRIWPPSSSVCAARTRCCARNGRS